MNADEPLTVERVRHVGRELLQARDLRAQVHADAELLWWHQRALHDAGAVVAGLELSTAARNRPVHVAPGIAFDARGRELVVTGELVIERVGGDDAKARAAAPPAALVLRRCSGGRPELAWIPLARFGRCDGVALARTDAKARGGLIPLAYRARPVARPRFGSGATLPGATEWKSWLWLEDYGLGLGLEVRVDTKPAGFAGRPVYFAWLRWPAADVAGNRPGFDGFGLQHLARETATGFTFRVMVVAPRAQWLAHQPADARLARVDDESSLITYARAQRLHVAWIGLQDDQDKGGAA